jgi:ketosteroid isomerase-like protein
MKDDPSAKLAQTACEAVARADAETLARICRKDVVWHVTGHGPHSGDHRGLKAVLDYLRGLGEAAEQFNLRPGAVLGGEDRATVIFHATGRRHGRVLDHDYVLLFRMEEQRIAEIWSVSFDQRADEDFWA